jgi:hypothetical protein
VNKQRLAWLLGGAIRVRGVLADEAAERWRAVRRVLTANRHELTRVAASLYPELRRVEPAELLCREEWVPDAPLGLDELLLTWDGPAAGEEEPAASPTGEYGARSEHVRPLRPDGKRYPSYAEAVAALDPPELLENRPCYRLLGARLTGAPAMRFGGISYFAGMDLGHAVAHELAEAWEQRGDAVRMAGLPLRALAGDPCVLASRPGLVAVTTLTLRRGRAGDASFVLHWRDPAKVNHGGGLYQVMPVGVFQPVTGAAAAIRHDLSLWRSMAREYSEEFLGTPEDYQTSGGLLDYEGWPFYRRLTAARREGRLTVHCLGLGVDPLTFATDILAVAVFDAPLFDTEFGGMVARNAEGRVISGDGATGIPFTAETVARLTAGQEPLQAAGVAVLGSAWKHRTLLLG